MEAWLTEVLTTAQDAEKSSNNGGKVMGFEDFLIINMINKENDKKEKDGFNDIFDDIFDNDNNEENNDF